MADELSIRVQLQNAQRAARELDSLADSTGRIGNESESTTRQLNRQAGAQDNVSTSAGNARAGIGKLLGVVGGTLAGASIFSVILGEADEANRAAAATNSVLASTGAVANVTADDVGNLANAISRKAGIDDEQIQGMENLLLTFTNVRNEVGKNNDIFNQATQAATDMAARFDMGPKEAAIALGKALNDPVKGITALSRVGVSFTQQQKDQVAAMVKNNDMLGAQKLILGELNTQVAGAAAANAQPIDRLRVNLGNLAEVIGLGLQPALNVLYGGLALVASLFLNFGDNVDRVLSVVRPFAPLLLGVAGALVLVNAQAIASNVLFAAFAVRYYAAVAATTLLEGVTGGLSVAMGVLNAVMAINPFVLAVAAGLVLAGLFVTLWKHSETFRAIVTGAFHAVQSAAVDSWNWTKGAWSDAKAWLVGAAHTISRAFSGIWDGFAGGAKAAINAVIGVFNTGIHAINAITPGPIKVAGKTIVPGIPDIPDIPMLARGGVVRGTGSWITGEAGPELNTKRGDGSVQVTPLAGSGTGTPGATDVRLTFKNETEAMTALLDALIERIEFRAARA